MLGGVRTEGDWDAEKLKFYQFAGRRGALVVYDFAPAREEKMSKDRLERKTYRRSPGRQYGYEYDPLHTQSHGTPSQGGRSRPSVPGQQTVQLAPRPDPRRTRQLLRQNILASKAKNALSEDPGVEGRDEQDITDQDQADLDEY